MHKNVLAAVIKVYTLQVKRSNHEGEQILYFAFLLLCFLIFVSLSLFFFPFLYDS